jgi:DNA-binding MarR family transcriptional regulator
LAKKTVNKFDKRLVCITITTKGLMLLKKMDISEAEMLSQMHHVTEAEAKQLNKLLDKIRGK